MQLLLIAYEFHPIQSAQALRWHYLVGELERHGHQVTVLTADLLPNEQSTGEVAGPRQVRRVFPGFYVGLSAWAARRMRSEGAASNQQSALRRASPFERAYRRVRRLLSQLLVPDVRTEWLPFAWPALKRAIREQRPDVLIASHEPGVDLALARRAHRAFGIPWIADVGDPVVAPYTPRWRRGVDAWFERRWLSSARVLLVTNDATKRDMADRVGIEPGRIFVLCQGFSWPPKTPADEGSGVPPDGGDLQLLFTGTLYADFRHPGALLQAVSELPGVQLTLLGNSDGLPPELFTVSANVRHLGRVSHERACQAQRQADVLVNIGNRDSIQIPGKIFEYFGAERPILHLYQTKDDPAIELLAASRRGDSVSSEVDAIKEGLQQMRDAKHVGSLDRGYCLDRESVAQWSWQANGNRLHEILQEVTGDACDCS